MFFSQKPNYQKDEEYEKSRKQNNYKLLGQLNIIQEVDIRMYRKLVWMCVYEKIAKQEYLLKYYIGS